jgi:hypothetical protein
VEGGEGASIDLQCAKLILAKGDLRAGFHKPDPAAAARIKTKFENAAREL